jgi:hypothetical protein
VVPRPDVFIDPYQEHSTMTQTHFLDLSSRLRALAIGCVFAFGAGAASAAFVSSGGGSDEGVPLYRAQVFGGIDTLAATDPGYRLQDIVDGIDYASNTTPLPVATGGGTRSASGGTMTASAWTAYSGFMAARNQASMTVSNAQATDDYYMVAGQGGTTQVRVLAQTPPALATFTWTVTGSTSAGGPGRADARLDFGATTSPAVSWFDLFDPQSPLSALSVFGPGTFSYTLPLTGQDQLVNLYYWSAAFVLLAHDTVPNGTGTSLSADFGSTFVLSNVELFDSNGELLTDWSMTDATTQALLFDAGGRVAEIADVPALPDGTVPEPAPAALLAAALLAAGVLRRARS